MADILAVVGSVTFACAERGDVAVAYLVAQIVADELVWRTPDEVTSGGADGVDTWAEQTCAELGVPTPNIYRPTARRWHGPGGFKERNQKIADRCTRLLAIRCAESRTYGSGWTRDEAKRQGKPTRTVTIHRDVRVDDTGWPPAIDRSDELEEHR